MKYTSKRKPNPVARELRGPRFRKRVVQDKRRKEDERSAWKQIVEYLNKKW